MIDSQLLSSAGDGSAISVYSPWFERGGDHAFMILDVADTSLGPLLGNLVVKVFHKNSEDVGDGSQVGTSSISRDSVGRTAAEFGPFKELVRYQFTIAALGAGDLRWALFRMLQPSWFDEVAA